MSATSCNESISVPDVSDADMAYGGGYVHLPKWADIPEEYKSDTPYSKFFETWFYSGLSIAELKLKPGVDNKKVWRLLQSILGSYQPKHEHKMAGLAYLLAQYSERPPYYRKRTI